MRFLVVGLQEEAAGKTTTSLALLHNLRDRGLKAGFFKPRAGNSVWYQYDFVRSCLEEGRLYSRDVSRIREKTAITVVEELMGPVHRLWLGRDKSPALSALPHFVLDRVALPRDGRFEVTTVRNQSQSSPEWLERSLRRLYDSSDEILRVSNSEEFNQAAEDLYEAAVEKCHAKTSAEFDAMVYESYSDVALPWTKLEDLDAVLAVKPLEMRFYPPERYLTAVEISSSMGMETSTSRIEEVLEPDLVLDISPSPKGERTRSLSRRLDEAIEGYI